MIIQSAILTAIIVLALGGILLGTVKQGAGSKTVNIRLAVIATIALLALMALWNLSPAA